MLTLSSHPRGPAMSMGCTPIFSSRPPLLISSLLMLPLLFRPKAPCRTFCRPFSPSRTHGLTYRGCLWLALTPCMTRAMQLADGITVILMFMLLHPPVTRSTRALVAIKNFPSLYYCRNHLYVSAIVGPDRLLSRTLPLNLWIRWRVARACCRQSRLRL